MNRLIIKYILSSAFIFFIFNKGYSQTIDTTVCNTIDSLTQKCNYVIPFYYQTTKYGDRYSVDSSTNFLYIQDSIATLQIVDFGGGIWNACEGSIIDLQTKTTKRKKYTYFEINFSVLKDNHQLDVYIWLNHNGDAYAVFNGGRASSVITYHGKIHEIGKVYIKKNNSLFK